MSKQISEEHLKKMQDGIKDSNGRYIFSLCGWEVWGDALNYQIRKDKRKYYWSTFLMMLNGLKKEIDNKSIEKSKTIDEAIKKVSANNERFIKDLKGVLASFTSLGKLEWN